MRCPLASAGNCCQARMDVSNASPAPSNLGALCCVHHILHGLHARARASERPWPAHSSSQAREPELGSFSQTNPEAGAQHLDAGDARDPCQQQLEVAKSLGLQFLLPSPKIHKFPSIWPISSLTPFPKGPRTHRIFRGSTGSHWRNHPGRHTRELSQQRDPVHLSH